MDAIEEMMSVVCYKLGIFVMDASCVDLVKYDLICSELAKGATEYLLLGPL